MQRNYVMSPVALLLITATFSIGMISGAFASTNASVQTRSYDPPNCANPCTIAITNAQFGNGRAVVIEQGTIVIWKNNDPIPYTTTISIVHGEVQEIAMLPFQSSIPLVYNSPGVFSFSTDSPIEGTLVVISPT